MYELEISKAQSVSKGKILKFGISLSILATALFFMVATLFTPISTYSKEFVYNLAINQQAHTPIIVISSPTEGEPLTGDVPIIGTAEIEPFRSYELYYKPESGGDDAYVYFGGGTNQVTNDKLDVWSTGDLAAGTYSLRLRVVKTDSDYEEAFVHNLIVNQQALTPTVASTSSVSLDARVAALETAQVDLLARIGELERAVVSKPITPVAIPTLTMDEGELYIVQADDKLPAIAEHFGVTVDQIMAANGLTDAKFLFSGQRLMIPVSDTLPIATPTPVALTPTVALPTSTPVPASTATPASAGIDYEIVSVNSKVTESNTLWERNSWIVTIKNNGPQTLLFNLTIEFLDEDGFILDQDTEYNLLLKPFETADYSGFALVDLEQSRNTISVNAKTLVTDYE